MFSDDPKDEHSSQYDDDDWSYSKTVMNRRSWKKWLILVLLGFTLSLTSLFFLHPFRGFNFFNQQCSPQLYDSVTPYGRSIKYIVKKPHRDQWKSGLYTGEPSNESEYAWMMLIGDRGARISPAEAEDLQIEDGIPLPDDGSIAVLPAVKHNLHCLRRLRQSLMEEYYYPDASEAEKKIRRGHNLHCIESLRTSVMCRPDLTALPYYRTHIPHHDLSARPDVLQQCVDWEDLQEELSTREILPPPGFPGFGEPLLRDD